MAPIAQVPIGEHVNVVGDVHGLSGGGRMRPLFRAAGLTYTQNHRES